MRIKEIKHINEETLTNLSIDWIDEDIHNLNELVEVSQYEAEAYYEAANTIYDMYIEAGDYVIENELFFELEIPFNLVDTVKKSWENDVHWHIYSYFKFSGGLDNQDIKLIGFEADTSDILLESTYLQWAMLKENDIDETKQYNEIYEKIQDNFKRLITLEDDTKLFTQRYDGWKILFSSLSNDKNTEIKMQLLQQIAEDAGFKTNFEYLENVEFSEDGIFDSNENEYEYWFKNYKWLDLASQEPELSTQVTSIIKNQKAIILNPAYTMLFESAGMLKILKKLYPNSPYLQNDINSSTNKYTANVFFAYEACGLSFNINNKFTGHTIV